MPSGHHKLRDAEPVEEEGVPTYVATVTLTGSHARPVYSVSLNRPFLATGCGDNSVMVFRNTPPNELDFSRDLDFTALGREIDAHENDVNSVAWCPVQSDILATAGDDGKIKLWKIIDMM
ncbi:unnamed protein product [Notodromas monacha]|uniref:Uncharacterized protein n=2 Tax=Notodromas monacha TaxID=399045 RepID=A0A7R9GKV3_9CRUS|nr:unnamed protein product [Notodromas monacha]CAG0925032.1 unnamed protein product [Notodromas monacha]